MAQQPNDTTDNLKTKPVSLDTLRETHTKSEFERLIFANLPRGDQENLVQMESYQVTNADGLRQLKGQVLNGITDGENVTWTDADKLLSQTDNNAKFDFDLYLRFDNKPGMVNTMKLGDLLGESTRVRLVISAEQNEAAFRDIEITDKTHLWMEMCTTPSKARHKVYQLFRAYQVLQPPPEENMVCLICLNGDWNETEAVADLLKNNPFVQSKAAEYRMDLAIAWTKHMNIYTSLFDIKDELGSLKNDMTKQMKEMEAGMKKQMEEMEAGIKNDTKKQMKEMEAGMKKQLEDLDSAIQEIKNALAPQPWGSFFKKLTLTLGQRGN